MMFGGGCSGGGGCRRLGIVPHVVHHKRPGKRQMMVMLLAGGGRLSADHTSATHRMRGLMGRRRWTVQHWSHHHHRRFLGPLRRRRRTWAATGRWTLQLRGGASRRRRGTHHALPGAPVEHGFDVLPRMGHLFRWLAAQPHVPPPRIEVGRIRLHVLIPRRNAMRMEYEFVGRKEQTAIRALDALGPRRIVPRRQKRPAAAPRTLVVHAERKVIGQPWRRIVAQERFAQPFRLAARYHAAAARADRHRSGAPQNLQLNGRALDAGDAEGHSPVVDFVVAELLEQGVGDLGETEALLLFDEEGDDRNAVENDSADLCAVRRWGGGRG